MSIKITSRGKGKSAVAAAAYRAGEKITNLYDGITHDYTRKGGVAHTEILLPDHAPREYFDRAVLWNAVEQIDKAKNAQLAREIELALPVELSPEQNIALARDYCQRHFVAAGMCADICIHDKNDGNPHAHIMLTMRPIEPDGSWGAKSKKEYILDESGQRITLPSGEYKSRKVDATDWNDRGKAEVWRQGWAEAVNAAMEQAGHVERIDHRSYERQGVERIPTVHLGVAAFQMEKRGIRTERGNINRQVELDNKMLRQLRARINKLKQGLDELLSEAASHPIPSVNLADILTGILERPEEKTRRQKITDLKTFARAIIFVQKNGVADLPALRDKVMDIYSQQHSINDRLKKVERRIKTLDEHITHADNYFQRRDIYRQYKQQKPNKRDAFFEAHRAELTHYEAAKNYLEGVMNGRTNIPRKEWAAERARLAANRQSLYAEYAKLKADVKDAEVIRRCVETVLRDEPQKQRSREMEL
ncbi:MobA/MobL family protein [Christensenellaceae bacterium OttesenSCG-928-L17]|nr:MobA/MobL family protein [Christensenellaceae bacterium OttesenSCG-928-L17]